MELAALFALVKSLLASAGLKGTVVLLIVGGFFYLAYKGVTAAGAFLAQMLASRDAMMAQLARDLKASDERRSIYDKETAGILATVKTSIDAQLAEARDTRKEMHQRFNKVQEDITTIRGATS